MQITNNDLHTNQYNYEILKANIYVVSLIDIIKTQKLTAEFCVKYILNPDFQFTEEEQQIDIHMVKKYQTHLTEDDFIKAKLNKRVDSFDDFDTFIN